MSKYIINNGNFYEVPDDTLVHWKYVKREKKNGKWQYTYDDKKSKATSAKTNYDKKNNAYKTWEKQSKSARAKNDKLSISSDQEIRNLTSWKTIITDHERSRDMKRKATEARKEYDKTAAGKIENASKATKSVVKSAKNWIKDKAGYDEKAAVESATSQAKLKKKQAEYYDDDMNALKERRKEKFGDSKAEQNFRQLIDDTVRYKYEDAAEAEEAARKAEKEFFKTPIGMLERAKDFVDDSEEYREFNAANNAVARADSNLSKKKEAYDEVKNKIASGEFFDKDNGNYSILEPYEREYRQAKRDFDNAVDRAIKAREDYMNTPQYKMYLASERIKEGSKKVSNWFKTHRL